ncbi:OLC1v1030551C1 [Oldenlandia corymbosa var. corymbosa]|uniref:OLC1v1030551C1 n=1 Tax=Oldenlandia corymbosa var. corymbosa TaxID=529605 RepID=A0AAV1CH72_OLDCO|nr:OLC1v1030551C1 [Oldenlandia corymbosa var. corymbosa]
MSNSDHDVSGSNRSGDLAVHTSRNQDDRMDVHGSDNPGVSIVSKLLVPGNYLSWSKAMRISLKPNRSMAMSMEVS